MTTRIPRSLIGVALASAMIIAPAAVFADNGNSNGHSQDVEHAPIVAPVTSSVSINGSGKVSLSGAKILSVGSSTLTLSAAWGSTVLTIAVNTANAKFQYKGGASASASALVAGDLVSVSGSLDETQGSLVVNAATVRDLSREKPASLDKHTFQGTLSAAIGTTSLPASFGFVSGNTTYTVNVPVGAAVLNSNWATTNLGTFEANDTVRVYGSVEAANATVIDAVVVRDASR